MKYVTMYQLVNSHTGDNVWEPFHVREAAEFWIDYHWHDCEIIEIEIEYLKKEVL